MSYDWYEKVLKQIEEEFKWGLLSYKEYQQALRDLNSEYDEYEDKRKE